MPQINFGRLIPLGNFLRLLAVEEWLLELLELLLQLHIDIIQFSKVQMISKLKIIGQHL